MAKVTERIELDVETWDRIDAARAASGASRDEVIDEAVRRVLGGRALAALFKKVRDRSDLTHEDAVELVAVEKEAMRAESAARQSARP